MKRILFILFLIPFLGISQATNAPSTYVATWNAAGVTGGIPDMSDYYGTVTDVANLQIVMNTASSEGGGTVIMANGNYDIASYSSFTVPDNVKLLGYSIDARFYSDEFIVGGSYSGNAKYMFHVGSNAGIANITIEWSHTCTIESAKNPDTHFWRGDDTGMCMTYANYCPLADDTTNDPCLTGNDYPNLGYQINGIQIDASSTNSFIKNVYITNIGSWPIRIAGDNNTLQESVVNGSYITGGGGNGYLMVSGSNNLVINNWIKRIRHLIMEEDGLSGGTAPTENVFVGNLLEVDYNLHNGDGGGNLFSRNSVFLSDTHLFLALATGSLASGHDPPGADNYLYKNTGVHTDVGYGNPYEEMFSDWSTVYYTNGTYTGDYATEGPDLLNDITDTNPAYVPGSGEFYTLPTGLKKRVLVYYDTNSLGSSNNDADSGDIYRNAIASYINSVAKDYDVHIAHDILGSDIDHSEQLYDFYSSVLIVTTNQAGVDSGKLSTISTWSGVSGNQFDYVDPSDAPATYQAEIDTFLANHNNTITENIIKQKRREQQGALMFSNE